MKKIVILLMFSAFFISWQNTNACEINFSVVGEEKESYQSGDEIIVNVEVVFTHRNCHEGIDNTKFKYQGVKVLGATKWEETSYGKFERKLKLQVVEGEDGSLLLEAVRTCRKEGGAGSISLTRS